MGAFTDDDLTLLRETEEIRIAPYAEDGFLYDGRLIWVVVAEGRVYIRSWKGADAEWFRRAARSLRAHITIDGSAFSREVTLARIRDTGIQHAIDEQYLASYPQPYAGEMVAPRAAETTLEVLAV